MKTLSLPSISETTAMPDAGSSTETSVVNQSPTRTGGLESLFSDNDSTEPSEPAAEVPVAVEPVPAKPENTDATEPDIDFLVSPEPKKEPEKKKEDVDPLDLIADPKVRESAAQKEAKTRGRENKELRVKVTEMEIELESLRSQNGSASESWQSAPREAFHDHPQVKPLIEKTLNDLNQTCVGMPSRAEAQKLKSSFSNLLSKYGQAFSNPDGYDERAELKSQIDLEYGEAGGEVMSLLRRNASATNDIESKISELQDRSKSKTLATGYEDYQVQRNELREALTNGVVVSDEVASLSPDAPESILAGLTKSDAWKKRVEQVCDALLDAKLGPKQYSQEEIDRVTASGKDWPAFQKERTSVAKQKATNLLVQAARALALLPVTVELYREHSGILDKGRELSEINALSGSGHSVKSGSGNVGKGLETMTWVK